MKLSPPTQWAINQDPFLHGGSNYCTDLKVGLPVNLRSSAIQEFENSYYTVVLSFLSVLKLIINNAFSLFYYLGADFSIFACFIPWLQIVCHHYINAFQVICNQRTRYYSGYVCIFKWFVHISAISAYKSTFCWFFSNLVLKIGLRKSEKWGEEEMVTLKPTTVNYLLDCFQRMFVDNSAAVNRAFHN